jgi:protein-S-isoprenylcysteine O-methyltransferase Ste14
MGLLVKNLLFTLIVPGTTAIYVPMLAVRGREPGGGAAAWLGFAMVAAGVAIYAWCLWDFATFGRGTPAPIDAPKKLVVRGLYRYTRNPMYVGVLTTVLGWALAYRVAALVPYAVLLAVCFHSFIVGYEEPHLRRTFGAEYDAYRGRVPRWVRPGSRIPRRQ